MYNILYVNMYSCHHNYAYTVSSLQLHTQLITICTHLVRKWQCHAICMYTENSKLPHSHGCLSVFLKSTIYFSHSLYFLRATHTHNLCTYVHVHTYIHSSSLTCFAPVLYSTAISPITPTSSGVPDVSAGLFCFCAINSCTKVAVNVSSNFTYVASEKSFP